jgi:hypothetical protein
MTAMFDDSADQANAAPTRKVSAAAVGTFLSLITALVAAGLTPVVATLAAAVFTIIAMVLPYMVPERAPADLTAIREALAEDRRERQAAEDALAAELERPRPD